MSPDKSESKLEFWKNALETHLAALQEEVLENGGTVAPERVRHCKDFQALLKIQKSLNPLTPTPRWPLALAFSSTLLVLSILFFRHVTSTRIDLDATVSQISFEVDDQTRFLLPSILRRAAIDGVTLDQQNTWACNVSSDIQSAFTFQSIGQVSGQNAISVNPLELPQGTLVTLTHTGNDFHQQLKLKFPFVDNDYPIIFTAIGTAQLKGDGCDSTRIASTFDQLIFHPVAHQTLNLSFESQAEDLPMPILIPASKISFFDLQTSSVPNTQYALPLSTLLTGSIFFDSVGARERKLREGERIEFSSFHGFVHLIHAQKDRFRTRLTGEVTDVRSGESDTTLKPTYFEYLTVSQGLPSLWGAVIYCFGLYIVVMNWWKPKS